MSTQPTERPIVGPISFVGAMISQILADRKTMTRRIVKDEWQLLPLENPDYQREALAKAPFQPNTRRWVQETHTISTWESGERRVAGYYDADQTPFNLTLTEREYALFRVRKNKRATVPGRFMYRSLSRITLEIEAVKVERVQEISRADAEAEGVTWELARDLFSKAAGRFKGKPIYYLESADGITDSEDYCKACAMAEIAKLPAEEGRDWHRDDGERDGAYCYCSACQTPLEPGGLTACACETVFSEGILGNGLPKGAWESWIAEQAFEYAQYYEDDADMMKHFHRAGFRALWDSINAKRDGGKYAWAVNPWVWSVSFRRVQP